MTDLTLHAHRVLLPGGPGPANVAIRGGRVHAVTPGAPLPGATELGDLVLLPGVVDAHVHINEPGRAAWEGFETATRAAAAGGITTLVDMPLNSAPVTTSLAALEAKLDAARGKLWVDVGFWGGVVPGNASELGPMVARGVLGFKCFLCPSGIDDFPQVTEADLGRAMPVLRALGVPLLFHAELEGEVEAALRDASPRSYLTYLHSRPSAWEDRAIARVIALVRETGCRAHIVHLGSASALPMLRAARAEGLPITVETCPHYLGFTAEEVPDGATEYKCAPPIRGAANREGLWEGLRDGTIDQVVSDHSPCVPALKRFEDGDFLEAWGGIASLQLGLPSVWAEARRRGFGLSDLARWMAAAPAGLTGLADRGAIAPGLRADLVAFRPDDDWTVTAEALHFRNKVSPWIGRRLGGRVARTWLGGVPVAADGAVTAPAPLGRPVLVARPGPQVG